MVRLQGEEIKEEEDFKLLLQVNSPEQQTVWKRSKTVWKGWRKVLGVMCDKRISARMKGKVC